MKMATDVRFLLLVASLLTQSVLYTAAKPQDNTKVLEELTNIFNTSDDEITSPFDNLKIALTVECVPLFNFKMHEGKKVFQKMLKDSEILANPSDDLETQLAEFSHYVDIVEKAEQHSDRVKLFDVVEIAGHFNTLVEKYEKSTLEKPSPVEKLIDSALKKNGFPELKADFNKRFMDTVPKFNAKIDAYLDSLSPEQRQEQTKLSQWYESYKTEQDVDKKRMIFSELFTLK